MYGLFCELEFFFPFVHDSLCLYVSFEFGRLKFNFVGATCDGAFGEVEVHVCPFCKLLEFVNLGLQFLDVVYE